MVAGGDGHSRLHPWALAGVTRELLTSARLPVLFSDQRFSTSQPLPIAAVWTNAMKQRSDLIDRAKMTVERAALALRDLRDQLDGADGLASHHQHALWDAVTDLEWRHSQLADLQLDMVLSSPFEVEDRWQRFSICHDDYREAAKEVRSNLTQACRGEAGGRGAAQAPAAAEPPLPPVAR